MFPACFVHLIANARQRGWPRIANRMCVKPLKALPGKTLKGSNVDRKINDKERHDPERVE